MDLGLKWGYQNDSYTQKSLTPCQKLGYKLPTNYRCVWKLRRKPPKPPLYYHVPLLKYNGMKWQV